MTVVGYEFPQSGRQPYDADWLKIRVDVKHPRGDWSKTDACLLTWELAELANWLNTMASPAPNHPQIEFMEPELRFEWSGGGENLLRIHLNYSLRPPWSPYHGPNQEEDLVLAFPLNPETLRAAARSLVEETKKFPVRVAVR